MKKRWFLMVLCALSVAALAACSSSADTMPSASPSPSVSPSMTPTVTVTTSPSASPEATAAGVTTIEDAKSKADALKTELGKLSELDEAAVVVAGNMALVGVNYDAQYQSGMTTRLTDMIEERVTTVDKSVTVVHTTDDEKLVAEIEKLAEQVDKGEITFSELQTSALEISTRIAGAGQPSPSATTGAGTGS